MARRLLTLMTAASLVLCAAAVVLWVRSYPGGRTATTNEDRFSWLHHGDRYTARSQEGRVTLYGPPGPPDAEVVLHEALQGIWNTDIEWTAEVEPPHSRAAPGVVPFPHGHSHEVVFRRGLPARSGNLHVSNPSECIPVLLRALEDPHRYVAAHYLL